MDDKKQALQILVRWSFLNWKPVLQKRLATLKKVRPAFMEEYEKMEAELRKSYEEYLVRFRCLAFLEQQVAALPHTR